MGSFCFSLMKLLIIFENVIVSSLACLLIYVSFSAMDRDFGMDTLNDNHPKVVHAYISAISAGVGIIILLLSSLGLFGAIRKSKTVLNMYAGIIFSMIVILTLAALFTLTMKTNGVEYRAVDKSIVNTTISIYSHNDTYEFKTRLLDQIQEKLQCCGINTPDDWKNYGQHKIPKSCCSVAIDSSALPTATPLLMSTTNQPTLMQQSYRYCEHSDFKIGCWRALTDYFHANLNKTRNILYVIIGFGLFSSIAAFSMSRRLKASLEVV